MKEEEALFEFRSQIMAIRLLGKQMNIDDNTINECLSDVFDYTGTSTKRFSLPLGLFRSVFTFLSILIKTLLFLVVLYAFASFHNPTHKLIMRNSQNLIYPLMRSIRLSTMHLITKYGSITEWHEEECLLPNPFYEEPVLDCWPCEDVRTLVDLTGLRNYTAAYRSNEKPFVVKDVADFNVTLDLLRGMYRNRWEELEKGTAMYISNDPRVDRLQKLWLNGSSAFENPNLHVMWKINRVLAAQVIRKIFKRPYFVPNNSEVALQKFLCIDGPESPQYNLPITDFADVWVMQGQGSRILVLDPSPPCNENCSSVSILLNPGNILYYNWQFWRPRSFPSRLSKEPSITFIGSFY
ncbi:uncharacterized protein [Centruroides vittatus]|uniref:uncharacterized protein n=1 Tax=Centruroides vittatus TaxID=120091 RepID=UPI00350ED402